MSVLRIAAGSNAEVRAPLHFAIDRGALDSVRHKKLVQLTERVGQMIRRLEQYLRQ